MARLERDFINATLDFESEKAARRLAQEQAETSSRKLQTLEQSIVGDLLNLTTLRYEYMRLTRPDRMITHFHSC